MSKIGLILACPHYPNVSDQAADIHPRLRRVLTSCGVTFGKVAVYAADDGVLPRHGAECDAWIVSGLPLAYGKAADDTTQRLAAFLRAAVALGRDVFAVHRAEHLVHLAVGADGAAAPTTQAVLRAIRNPFRSFSRRDSLYRFDPSTRQVVALVPREAGTPLRRRRVGGAAGHV